MAEQVEAITSIVPSQEVAQPSLTEVIGSALASPGGSTVFGTFAAFCFASNKRSPATDWQASLPYMSLHAS